MTDPFQAVIAVILAVLLVGYLLALCSPVDEPYTIEEVRETR
jgi:hypothetical protein